MKQIKLLKSILVCCLIVSFGTLSAQYQRQYQGLYPYNQSAVSAKANDMTIPYSNPYYDTQYNVLTSPRISSSLTALGILRLNEDLEIVGSYVYTLGGYSTVHFDCRDIEEHLNGGKVVCGSVEYGNVKEAFVAAFDGTGSHQWIRTYPDVTVFNALALKPDPPYDYIACGAKQTSNGSQAYIMRINTLGQAVWARALTQWDSEFTDIESYFDLMGNYHFALTGWVNRGMSHAEKEILYSNIENNGNSLINYYFYHPFVTGNDGYYEEGLDVQIEQYGLDIYITGVASKHPDNSSLQSYSDVLLIRTDIYGSPPDATRYDVGGLGAHEYGTSVTDIGNTLAISGHMIDDAFSSQGSTDAFILLTNPLRLHVYGGIGTDVLMNIEENMDGDGYVAIGYSTSWSTKKGFPHPYVVETYGNYSEECNSLIETPIENTFNLSTGNFTLSSVTAQHSSKSLFPVNSTSNRDVLCAKVSSKISTEKSFRRSEQTTSLNEINVFPSLATESLTINHLHGITKYVVFSATGALVTEGQFNGNSSEKLDVSSLNQGVYLLQLKTEKGNMAFKFVKQ